MREADLLRELQNVKEEYEILKEQYDESQEIVEEYKTSSSSNDALIAAMKSDLEKANVLAGLADVRGEGVVVTSLYSLFGNCNVAYFCRLFILLFVSLDV